MTRALLLLLFPASLVMGQEEPTYDQLLERSASDPVAVSSYIAGWRDATNNVLLDSASTLRDSSGDMQQFADYMEARGNCIGRLGVADLFAQLRTLEAEGHLRPKIDSAMDGLNDAGSALCQDEIAETNAR